jgi:hypothetical protein
VRDNEENDWQKQQYVETPIARRCKPHPRRAKDDDEHVAEDDQYRSHDLEPPGWREQSRLDAGDKFAFDAPKVRKFD